MLFLKSENYSVRDNGAVLRHSNSDRRKRKDDDVWTFGNAIDDKGFYTIGKEKVHKIVAIAFCGNQPSSQYVVFHKNYNKKDNRAANLMWVTKFQFHILQEKVQAQFRIVTQKKIEEILSDFESVKNLLPKNLAWMSKISQAEADKALQLYIDLKYSESESDEKYLYIKSLTAGAVQKHNWRIPSEFPCCPPKSIKNSLETYFINLKKDSIFCKNAHYKTIIDNFSYNKDKTAILVKGKNEDSVKPYSLCKITCENNEFVHENCGSFFREDGAEKYFTLGIGEEWTGGTVFDEQCL